MRSLQEQLVVPVDDTAGRRATLVYAPSEYVRIVPYAKSYLRMALYVILLVLSFGILLIVSVWFPQIFTRIARIRLPYSCLGDAEYMLVLVHEDGMHSVWIEVPVQRPIKKKSGADKSATANGSVVEVTTPSDDRSKLPWVWFEFKKHRYVFNHEKGEFERYLATVNEDLDKIKARVDCGLDKPQVAAAKSLFGDNSVDIAKPSILMLLFTKTVHPYYMFQVFSSVVWLCQDYVSYAVVILTLSAISLTWEIYSEISNNNRLRKLVKSDHKIQVLRAGAMSDQKMIEIPEAQLVPGDIVQLSTGPVVADVLLLSGSCVVDEASLTGEAIPINKEAARGLRVMITDADARIHFKSSFLHAGSSITRVRDATAPCKAVVLSTGFSTGKGELFRSILFPRTITFEFERDSYRYLAVLTVIAIAAFIKRVMDFVNRGDGYGVFYIIVESLDLVTTAVPPALPLVLSSGIGFAMDRLKKGGIFCIDAKRINSCGQLDTFCFDKTGTLTEESLTLVGLDKINEETLKLERVDTFAHAPALLKLAMATCHGLTRADEETELQGYSLELAMFAAAETKIDFIHERTTTNYVATVETADKQQYGILKRFPFDAACQRSSVIVEDVVTKQRYVFVKGSPEAIGQIAIATPAGFKKTTLRYSAEGNYCIGFGMRELSATETINADSREAVESKVAFMGMALFHNELKPESKGMIQELYDAAVDVRMITGDNALTAVHVARLLDMKLKSKVAIVDVNESSEVVYHCVEAITSTDTEQWELLTNANVCRVLNQYDLALTGAALEILRTELSDDSIDQLVRQTTIFARIRPAQKTWIVERLMDFGKVVGMCGDGTNDCGALKAAHVGLALSSAEASIVAPFTSKAKAVTDVPALIREGRSALTTSFLAFKFMVMYPVIQLAMSSTLGHFGTRLSNNQFIWDDGVIVLGLAMTMLYTGSSSKLTKERPPNTLFSLSIVASILSQTLLYIAFFGGMLAIMMQQTWFCARADGMDLLSAFVETGDASINSTNCAFYTDYLYMVDTEVSDIKVSHEDTTVWQFGHMAYFSVALAFNLKDRFRLPFYTNKWFTGYFLVCLGVTLWFLMDTSDVINKPFHMLSVPGDYRAIMLGLFIGHFILSQIVEMLATWWLPQWRQTSLDKREEATNKQRSQSYLVQPPQQQQQEEPLVVAVESESHNSQSSSQNEDAAQTSVKVSSESSASEISHHTITTTTTTATTATATSS